MDTYEKVIKRAMDITLSGLALILLSWLYLILAALIVLDDPGPAVFTQTRVGRGKTLFQMHKFRSMKRNTPHDIPTHLLEDPERYITRIGHFLRRSSLDELPQIWDIFTGKMAIIGPRPALWNQDDLIRERDRYQANDVRPGLTGWAQINGRDELEIPVKARLDGEYVKALKAGGREAFAMDLRCFFGSIRSVLTSEGYAEGNAGDSFISEKDGNATMKASIQENRAVTAGEGERGKSPENRYLSDPRFAGIEPFESKIWLSSPTMHGEEQKWVDKAIQTNWVSTIGENINEVERLSAEKIGRKYAVALTNGTAALHLATKLCGERLYGRPPAGHGCLEGRRVFCSDMTFDATVNPVAYEGGEAVFIDTEYDTWNMDPAALERAFELYPEVRLIVMAHLYGTPGKVDELRAVADAHGALIVEDAAESFCATYKGVQTGCFGTVSVLSWNGNKLITGSAGGMLLTDSPEDAAKARKWSTQSRESAPWYQHEEMGYNYRMSNLVAGVVRGQLPHAEEHRAQKKAIYERYRRGLADLPLRMNPVDWENSEPNYWLSCVLLDEEAMCRTVRSETEATYVQEAGKSCPTEILEALAAFRAEGRPIWKPMHLQPIYRAHPFVTRGAAGADVGRDIFRRGLCLPSDNKMTAEQVDRVVEIVHRCFR